MTNHELAKFIIENVGGEENISSVTHCVTRLRFALKDNAKANTEVIKGKKGVMGVVEGNGQYQVIIGTEVNAVYSEVEKLLPKIANGEVEADDAPKADKKWYNVFLEGLSSLFAPAILALTAGGLIKAIEALLVALKVISNSSQTYLLLSYLADAPFYFLPFILAYGTARRFKGDVGLALMLAGFICYPSIAGLFADGAAVKLFGFLPVTQVTYTSTVAPIILIVICMCYVQHWLEKVVPGAIKPILVPTGTVLIAGILGIVILGPLGFFISKIVADVVLFLSNKVPWLVPTLNGAFMPFLVMTGTHLSMMPLGVQALTAFGKDTVIGPGGLASNMSQGGAALGVALATKDKDRRQLGLSTGITALTGTTEPALYGLNLQLKYPLIACMIGGGIGGFFLGITKSGRYAMGPSSLLMLPAYIGGDSMTNFYCGCIGAIGSIIISFAIAFILTKRKEA